ncbi:MAG TPA: metallopeptidase TldD-related protein, partial [Oscillatoriaceae cyanobacterium]
GFTREGVPAREIALIREGRLLTPLLDLKHAKRAEMAPTPFPRGGSSLRLAGPTVPYEQLIAELDSGLIVYEMLGLHTQDSSRGNFSLTVSQGLVVEKGQIIGQTKAIIAGNVFAALQEPFRLGRQEGKEVPALQIHADVTVS